jgi:hypothetical protein
MGALVLHSFKPYTEFLAISDKDTQLIVYVHSRAHRLPQIQSPSSWGVKKPIHSKVGGLTMKRVAAGFITVLLSACSSSLSGSKELASNSQETVSLKPGIALVAVDGTRMHAAARPEFKGSKDTAKFLQQGGVLRSIASSYNWTDAAYISGPSINPSDQRISPLRKIDETLQALCAAAKNPSVSSVVLSGYSRGVSIALTALRRIHDQGGCGSSPSGEPIYPKVTQFLFIENVPICLVPAPSRGRRTTQSTGTEASVTDLVGQVLQEDVCADLAIPADQFTDGVATVEREVLAWGIDWLSQDSSNGPFDCLHIGRMAPAASYGPIQEPWILPVQAVAHSSKCSETTGGSFARFPHDGMGFAIAVRDLMTQTINARFAAPPETSDRTDTEGSETSGDDSASICPAGTAAVANPHPSCSLHQTADSAKFDLSYFPVYKDFPNSGTRPENVGLSRFFKVTPAKWCKENATGQTFAWISKHPDQFSGTYRSEDKLWIREEYIECAD